MSGDALPTWSASSSMSQAIPEPPYRPPGLIVLERGFQVVIGLPPVDVKKMFFNVTFN